MSSFIEFEVLERDQDINRLLAVKSHLKIVTRTVSGVSPDCFEQNLEHIDCLSEVHRILRLPARPRSLSLPSPLLLTSLALEHYDFGSQ